MSKQQHRMERGYPVNPLVSAVKWGLAMGLLAASSVAAPNRQRQKL